MNAIVKLRGYILVLLATLWATLPAFAGLCPQQAPPCCRAMHGMCCISTGASGFDTICCARPSEAAVFQNAVANATERGWHAASLAMVVNGPTPELLQTIPAPATVAASPPLRLSHTHSILRI